MADDVVNVILQLCPPHFELLDLLVRSKFYFFLDFVNFIVQPVILIEEVAEMVISASKPLDDFTMFRELSEYRVMKVHGCRSPMVDARGFGLVAAGQGEGVESSET